MYSFWRVWLTSESIVFVAIPEYRCPLQRPRSRTLNRGFGVYLIVIQGNGSLYPSDTITSGVLTIERGHPASLPAHSDWLFTIGADPFLTTITGENALCMAVYHFINDPTKNDFSCLEILLQTGCKFGLKNKWYDILLKMAFNSNHIKLAQWLIRHHKTSSNKTFRCSSTPPVTKHYKFST